MEVISILSIPLTAFNVSFGRRGRISLYSTVGLSSAASFYTEEFLPLSGRYFCHSRASLGLPDGCD